MAAYQRRHRRHHSSRPRETRGSWRQPVAGLQPRRSFWPDAPWDNGPWDADAECVSMLMLPVRSFTYVLRYPNREAVPIIGSCHGWTDGTRTRLPVTYTPPHLTDDFIALYESQP
jgi:hypothetical protein